MGQGIAQLCVEAGLPTLVYDVSSAMLPKAKAAIEAAWDARIAKGKLNESDAERFKSMLQYSDRSEDLRGDLLIEAVIESASVKRALFGTVETQNGPETVLASNTSSIPGDETGGGDSWPIDSARCGRAR